MSDIPNLTVPIRTLTPIWTGGVNRDGAPLRLSGLLGSMRAWYEGIVRGMGGTACDPTTHTCSFDHEAYANGLKRGWRGAELLAYAGLCPACQLFGATSWQRRFRLDAKAFGSKPLFFVASNDMYQAAGNWLWRIYGGEDTGGKKFGHGDQLNFTFGVHTSWALQGELRVVALDVNDASVLARIAYLLDVMARYGAIGAKTQNGFGQFVPIGLPPEMIEWGRKLVQHDVAASKPVKQPDNAFSLGSFFSRVYAIEGSRVETYRQQLREIGAAWPGCGDFFLPCSFDIRYKSKMGDIRTGHGAFGMRPWFKATWGRTATNVLLGETEAQGDDERCASRLHVSHLYRMAPQLPWTVKVWGYVPPNLQSQDGTKQGLRAVADTVNDFLAGANGMFPGSKRIVAFIRKEVL